MKLSEVELACALHDGDELRARMARQLVEVMRRLKLAENALEKLSTKPYAPYPTNADIAYKALQAIRCEADV